MLEDKLRDALTFDDVLLVPAYSEVIPRDVDVSTRLTPLIPLRMPLVSSAMDTVTEAATAIRMAREGGIGFVHKNLSIEDQAREISRVKKAQSGMVVDPLTIAPQRTLEEALTIMRHHKISGLPVIDADRRPLGILTNRDVRFEPNAQQSAEWNRGAYLAEALAHCGECHTPRNLAFALDNRNKFAGAITAGWRAFNITSDKTTGLGDWRDEELASYLATGHAIGHGTASGPMGEAVDESFSKLAPEDIRALVTFLRSVPPIASPDLPATRAPAASPSHKVASATSDPHGKMLFEGACVSCHGWSGQSAGSPFATLTGAWAVNDPGATNVAQIVISGTRRHGPTGAISMPAFGAIYSDNEIAILTNYVTARFGTKPSAITAEQVAELRKQTAQ